MTAKICFAVFDLALMTLSSHKVGGSVKLPPILADVPYSIVTLSVLTVNELVQLSSLNL